MSGIEIAGLAFGILPVLIEAVKSYSSVSRKVQMLRHYCKEIKSVSKQLGVHNGIFLNEVRLLLRLIEIEKEVESMLSDVADQRWSSAHLDERLRYVLRDSFDVCRSINEETTETIEAMREELGTFDILLSQRTKGESFKTTLKRLGGAIKITFDRSRYDQCLSSLRDRNGDLKALRSQISAFQRQDTVQKARTPDERKLLPSELVSIKNASHKLHDALCRAWCCDDPAHQGHYAKLCIGAQADVEVRLDLAISCHATSSSRNETIMGRPPTWFYVLSLSTSFSIASDQNNPRTTLSDTSRSLQLLTSCSLKALKKKPSSDLQNTPCRKKIKRGYGGRVPVAIDVAPEESICVTQPLNSELNLCQHDNICSYLRNYEFAYQPSNGKHCVGYLETPHMYKHLFYIRHETDSAPAGTSLESVVSIFDIMRYEAEHVVTVKDQLKLAQKTALALLQFDETPWLPERWRLRDLNYLGSKHAFDATALKTLHLSSQISVPKNSINEVKQVPESIRDEVHHGINNTALFFLGVALLEIAYWKPIEEKMTARDSGNEVFAARRLAASRAPLGPHYQKIAEKCLQCNFGHGTNLSSEALRTAVYNDVVCKLDNMIIDL